MDIKTFFAKDIVKVVAGGLYVIGNGLLFFVMKEGPTKQSLILIWNGVIAPLATFLGIASGGTSGLRNDTSNSVTNQLVSSGKVTLP